MMFSGRTVVTLTDFLITDTTNIGNHMLHVAVVLLGDFTIYIVNLIVAFPLVKQPLVEVCHNKLQVADAIVAGLDVVVTKVFGLVGGIDGSK